MNEQRRYKEPKDTLWGKCLSTFIAIVFAVSTLTIIPIAGALTGTPTGEQTEALESVKTQNQDKATNDTDEQKDEGVDEKVEITTLALEDEKDDGYQKPTYNLVDLEPSLIVSEGVTYNEELSQYEAMYNGNVQKPGVSVKTKDGVMLTEGTDYTVVYDGDFTKPGKYGVLVKVGTSIIHTFPFVIICTHPTEYKDVSPYFNDNAPSCENRGSVWMYCKLCESNYHEVEVPALGHDWSQWESDGENGHKHHCTRCGKTESENHDLTSKEMLPTCTQKGNEWMECKICGFQNDNKEIAPLGHKFPDAWTDCTPDGKSHDGACKSTQHKMICTVCGGKEDGGILIEDHAYGNWKEVTPADFDKKGLEERECKCGHKEQRDIPIVKSYVVKWLDGYTNDALKTERFKMGYELVESDYPSVPPRVDYDFVDWGEPVEDETGNVTITAQWKIKTYTVKWLNGYDDNADAIKTVTLNKDEGYNTLYPADNPTRDGYRFTEWSEPAVDEDTGNVTIRAQWIKQVDVIWINWNGDQLHKTTVDENDVPAATTQANPTRLEDDNFTYGFNRWIESEDEEGNVTYRAEYTPAPKMITVTWLKGYDDGTSPVIASTTAFKVNGYTGGNPEGPAREGYTFAGWSEPATDAAGNITFTAQWTIIPDEPTNPDEPTPGPVTPPTNPDNPAGPTTPTTPGDGTTPVTPPAATPGVTPAVATPADAAAPAAAVAAVAAVETIADGANPLAAITTPEAIDDDANAMAAFEEVHCWTHWLMIFGALVTIVYGLGVLYMRRKEVRDFDDFEDNVTGKRYEASTATACVSDGAPQAM